MDIAYSKFGGSREIINADEDLDDAEPVTLKKELVFELKLPAPDTKEDSLTLEQKLDAILTDAGIDPASVKLSG
ncbi:hypothetical protein CAP48_12330 [Advenella sp. S44]|uniref:hypothetical protein n=1 Tax=Advenella sp. S44 TaxID=1982755 RepID=UPI000C29C71C|nr:hypothetical protein [Advenella sp. S44]PJX23855.1 hypothetical protein CAP48_12330 [Advenella sp. S44]